MMQKMNLTIKIFSGILLLTFCMLNLSFAQEKKEIVESEWKIEDVINQESAGNFVFSRDGSRALWVKSTSNKKKDRRISHIFITYLGKDNKTLQLTRGEYSEFSPKWSPSEKIISFLSSRKGEGEKEDISGNQLWFLDSLGGEPWKITTLQFGVRNYEWIDDNHILLLTRENRSLREQEKKKRKDTSYVAEDQEHMLPYRLFILDIKKKKNTRLTENKDQIISFVLSHNKKWVLTRNNQSLRFTVDQKIKPKFYLTNLEDKSSTELFSDAKFKPSMLTWAADDTGFYFSVTRTSDYVHGGPGADFLYYFDLNTQSHTEVPLDWEWGLFYLGFQVRDDGFITSLANGAKPKWRRYYKNGSSYTYKELEGKHLPNIYGLILQEKGDKIIYQFSTASKPAQWFSGTLDGNLIKTEKQIFELNSHLKNKTKAKTQIIRWTGALDEEIEGILYYPHNYEKGKKYPLILMIHGGPTGVDMDRFRESWAAYPNILAQNGAFILRPNYHGSGGYGQKFAESIKGHYYDYEIPDMLKGIDELIKKRIVDPDKIGAMGWSNGGILTIGLSVWTDRLKIAGVGAADANWTSDYGNCAFGVSFDNYYFKGPVWEEIDHYIQKSPLFHAKKVEVPTIIFHGTQDTNVPYEQGWEYYRALQQIGKIPVRFIVFPGEPHGLQKLTHQNRKMKEEIDWFDKYFFNTKKTENEALKKGSPLDLAFKRKKIAKVQNLYGKKANGYLIPEVVKSKNLELGRFEITRAQWASFDNKYEYEPGTGNFPVNGISFEQVREYINWLTTVTGEEFRMPSVEEAEKLAKMANKGNTLDYWAGYNLNPDDAELILKKVKSLEGSAPLLMPVDRFEVSDDELVYGLGGNVSEWAVTKEGKGKIVGKSAITPKDPNKTYTPPLEYVGLRVIKGKKKD